MSGRRSGAWHRWALQDWEANAGNPKARLVLVLFRLAQRLRGARDEPIRPHVLPYLIFYRLTVEWVLGIELPWNTEVGPGLRIFHGQGLVVNDGTVIGRDCVLRQSTTIGNKGEKEGHHACPVLGDGVEVGANAVILGAVNIGNFATIAAGATVTHDVPEGAVVLGPAAQVRR